MKNVLRRVSVVVLALIMTMAMTSGAFAASGISKSTAVNKALKSAGVTKSQVKYLESEYDDGRYEIEFTKKSNGTEYSFEYKKSGTLMEKSVEYHRSLKGGKAVKSKAAARAKVAAFNGFKKSTVANGSTYKVRDDGRSKYEVKFKSGNFRYEYDVDANSGKITEWSKERYR